MIGWWRLLLFCSAWRKRPLSSAIAFLTFTLGLFLSSLCLQLWLNLQQYLDQNIGNHAIDSYLVISKDISPLLALRPESVAFSKTEISQLAAEHFIKKVDPIISNQFRSELVLELGASKYGTELFFESIPPAILSPVPPSWDWPEPETVGTAKTVPIIIPREFLGLYNLGFAPARHLPLLQESTLSLIPLRLRIESPTGLVDLPARIVGTTNKITSLIVPHSFMNWANRHYASDPKMLTPLIRRLLLHVKDLTDPSLADFLRNHGYKDDQSSSALRDAALLISLALGVLGIIAIVILLLSLLVFLLNLRIFLQQNLADLGLLMLLGYHPSRLALMASLGSLAALLPLGLLTLALVSLCTDLVHAWLAKGLFSFPSGVHAFSVGLILLCLMILPLLQFVLIRKHLAFPRGINHNETMLQRV